MKLSVDFLGKFVVANLILSQYNNGVSAVKWDLQTFIPDTLRKAKQGFNVLLRRAPVPPVLVIPQRTGIASIDQALFQTTQIGSTIKGSISRQVTMLKSNKSVSPNIFVLLLCIIPGSQFENFISNMFTDMVTVEQTASVKDGLRYLQTIVRVLMSSHIAQLLSVTLKDVIMNHVSSIHPTAQKAIVAFPTVIPQIAILTLIVHGLVKFNNAVVRPFFRNEPSTSTTCVSPIVTGTNEFMASFTPIQFDEDDSVVVTDISQNPEYVTMPVSTDSESTNEEKAFEVNVTKISAVLDRFESKILSLVGGTRFHPSPAVSEVDEFEQDQTDSIETVNDSESVMSGARTTSDGAEMMDLINDGLINVTQEDEIQAVEAFGTDENNMESEVEEKWSPSLKSYEIALPSSPSPLWSTLTSPSCKAAVRAFGVISCALSSVNVLPPIVRYGVAAFAVLFILGMVVQEVRGAWSTCKNVDALDSLIHDIEARTLSYTNDMEPLVVASRQDELETSVTTRSSLRFWRTRLPILDGIATFSSHILSRGTAEVENATESVIQEEEEDISEVPLQFESDVHYFNESQEGTQSAATSPAKSVWRWMSPVYSQPKMTRTACTAIVGM